MHCPSEYCIICIEQELFGSEVQFLGNMDPRPRNVDERHSLLQEKRAAYEQAKEEVWKCTRECICMKIQFFFPICVMHIEVRVVVLFPPQCTRLEKQIQVLRIERPAKPEAELQPKSKKHIGFTKSRKRMGMRDAHQRRSSAERVGGTRTTKILRNPIYQPPHSTNLLGKKSKRSSKVVITRFVTIASINVTCQHGLLRLDEVIRATNTAIHNAPPVPCHHRWMPISPPVTPHTSHSHTGVLLELPSGHALPVAEVL